MSLFLTSDFSIMTIILFVVIIFPLILRCLAEPHEDRGEIPLNRIKINCWKLQHYFLSRPGNRSRYWRVRVFSKWWLDFPFDSLCLAICVLWSQLAQHLYIMLHQLTNTQQTRDVGPVLDWCWPSVVDGGTTLVQHWANVSCLLGMSATPNPTNTRL